MKITFFGVWAALQPNIDNTYFLIEDWKNRLQVDASWGLKLAQMVKRKEIYFENIFISHTDTDHFLWIFNLFRTVTKIIPKLNIYCSKKIENNIKTIAPIVLRSSLNKVLMENWLNFINLDDLKEKNAWEFIIEPINVSSNKSLQFWFILKYNSKKIVFFWDDATNILKREDLQRFNDADLLICEALIPEDKSLICWWKTDLKKFCHSSSKQAWKIAKIIKAKKLAIIHTREIPNRIEELKEDASKEFSWEILIPEDMEEVII